MTGGARVYGHYHELLADPGVDAVLTAVPIESNGRVLMDSLAAGKHVIAEKPIAAWQQAQKHPATGYLTAAESQALRDATPPPPRPAVDGSAALPAIGGLFSGSLSGSATGGGAAPLAPMEADLRLVGRQLIGRIVHPVCGSQPVLLAVDPAGTVSGSLRLPEAAGCTTNAASASGRVAGSTLTLNLRGADVSFRGTLSSHAGRSPGPAAPPSGMRTDMP